MRILLFVSCLLFSQNIMAQSGTADQKLQALIDNFEKEYYTFNWPTLSLDFKVNLNNVVNDSRTADQKKFFQKLSAQLDGISPSQLSESLRLDYEILRFEADLNLDRLTLLEKTPAGADIDELTRIYDFAHGPQWYAWLIKRWTGTAMSPEEVMAFGRKEAERVKARMDRLQLPDSKPEHYYTRDRAQIVKTLKDKRDLINNRLFELFPDYSGLPGLQIAQGTDSRLAQAPGYYDSNTFYFNLFEKPFDLTDSDWMLIHEGNPGHHFQINYHNDLVLKPYRRGLRSLGFIEGWAAYTENLGWELGLYKDPWEEMGKWNWDIIRSVRIVLDVGLNYHGWTDAQSLEFWQQYIQGQDDIAMREINRMKRWPAQVLTYKLGEAAILQALAAEKEQKGSAFSFKDFHASILGSGPVPAKLIPQLLK